MMELKPCPFCGQEVECYDAKMYSGKITYLEVRCKCGGVFTFDLYEWGKSADETWNKRAFAIAEEES